MGIKDWESNHVDATSLPHYRGNTVEPFIIDNMLTGATVESDDSIIRLGLRGMAKPPTSRHD